MSKWYLDCITAEGDAVILYSMTFRWGLLFGTYAGALVSNRSGQSTDLTRRLSKHGISISSSGKDLLFKVPALQVDGQWSRAAEPITETLYECDEGSVNWNCLQPRSEVKVKIAEQVLVGIGYVERLDMTVRPWKLPIQELEWGRYHSQSHTAIWIRWKGPHPICLNWCDGTKAELPVTWQCKSSEQMGHIFS